MKLNRHDAAGYDGGTRCGHSAAHGRTGRGSIVCMSVGSEREARELVDAALRLHSARLWDVFEEDDTVAVEIPGEENTVAALVMGQGGQEYGVAIFLGGLRGIAALFGGGSDAERMESFDEITVMIRPLFDIPPPLRGLLDLAGWRGRGDDLVPDVAVKYRGEPPREPRPDEVRLALYVIKALLHAHEDDELDPLPYDTPGGVQLLRVSGWPHAPAVAYDIHREARLAPRDPSTRAPRKLALTASAHRPLPVTWMAGLFPLTATVAGAERVVPTLLVAEQGEDGIVAGSCVLNGKAIGPAAAALVACADGDNEYGEPALPREIHFLNGDLFAAAGPVFARAGVRCRHVPSQPELETLAEDLAHHVASRLSELVELGFEDEPEIPEYEDSEADEWLWARDELLDLGRQALRSRNLSRERIWARYVGNADLGAELFGPGAPPYLTAPLLLWSIVCYRPTRKSKTVLETVLERKTLPASVRELAEGLRDATPSLYEVVETRESVIGVCDVATGEVYEEVVLPMPTRVGSLWPGFIHRAGPYLWLAPIGPAIPPSCAANTPDQLANYGIAISHKALARHHYFGGLIAWWVAESKLYDLDDPFLDADLEPRPAAATEDAGDRLLAVYGEMQRRWLDAELPIFDGKTPREMCQSDEGKTAVAELIRSMANPSPQISYADHEKIIGELLDELGLA